MRPLGASKGNAKEGNKNLFPSRGRAPGLHQTTPLCGFFSTRTHLTTIIKHVLQEHCDYSWVLYVCLQTWWKTIQCHGAGRARRRPCPFMCIFQIIHQLVCANVEFTLGSPSPGANNQMRVGPSPYLSSGQGSSRALLKMCLIRYRCGVHSALCMMSLFSLNPLLYIQSLAQRVFDSLCDLHIIAAYKVTAQSIFQLLIVKLWSFQVYKWLTVGHFY